MKKDLNILKTLEFPSVQSEDDSRPLEVLILERSKALQVKKMYLLKDKNQESCCKRSAQEDETDHLQKIQFVLPDRPVCKT